MAKPKRASSKNAKKPKLSLADYQQRYGYTAHLLEKYPELKQFLNTAIQKGWVDSPSDFNQHFQKTSFYVKHSDSWRKYVVAKYSGDKSFAAGVEQRKQSVMAEAQAIGAVITEKQADYLARVGWRDGWDQTQARQYLARYVKPYTNGSGLGGAAGEIEAKLRLLASQNGLSVTDPSYFVRAAQSVLSGKSTVLFWQNELTKQAAAKYPSLAGQLLAATTDTNAGPMTVRAIADSHGYLQAMQDTLEIPAGSVDLKDPLMEKALKAQDENGKPTSVPLWKFERDLRQDSRWMSTNNAQGSIANLMGSVAQKWGLS